MFPLSTLITQHFSHVKYVTTTFFLDKKLRIVLFYNSKLEFMFSLVTLITKRFSQVKLSLNSEGWLSFATQVASSENKSKRKRAVNSVWGPCVSKTTEVSWCEFKHICFFYWSLKSLFLFFTIDTATRDLNK